MKKQQFRLYIDCEEATAQAIFEQIKSLTKVKSVTMFSVEVID